MFKITSGFCTLSLASSGFTVISADCLSLSYVNGILFKVTFGFTMLPTSDPLSIISTFDSLLFVPCCVFETTTSDLSILLCITSLLILEKAETILSSDILDGEPKLDSIFFGEYSDTEFISDSLNTFLTVSSNRVSFNLSVTFMFLGATTPGLLSINPSVIGLYVPKLLS